MRQALRDEDDPARRAAVLQVGVGGTGTVEGIAGGQRVEDTDAIHLRPHRHRPKDQASLLRWTYATGYSSIAPPIRRR